MLKVFTGQRINDALRKAIAAGVTEPKQIRSTCRRYGFWNLLCEVKA